MASCDDAVYNTSKTQFGVPVGFFDTMPTELILYITEQLLPADLFSFMTTCKEFFELIISRIPNYVALYLRVSNIHAEKLMWSMFNYEHMLIQNTQQLFLRMLGVYKFASTTLFERMWETEDLENHFIYGGLLADTNENELYEIKIQTGMIYGLVPLYELNVSGKIGCMKADDLFTCIFKFINKYSDIAVEWEDDIEDMFSELIDIGITFETIDDWLQQALSYNVNPLDIYDIMKDGLMEPFLRMLSYGVDVKYAISEVENDDFPDERLEAYNAIRYIIGNKLACHYILDDYIEINPLPDNFLENIRKCLDNNIQETYIIDTFLENPTNERFDNILVQLKIFGFVNISLL